jgi:diaminopimelate epimerase
MTDNLLTLPFIKMHGAGNDFIIIDARENAALNSAQQEGLERLLTSKDYLTTLCNRRFGIGCDQLVVLEEAEDADALMRILNADGSEVSACGNATRCIGWLLAREKNTLRATIRTRAGLLATEINGHHRVRVNMGRPRWHWQDIPLASAQDTKEIRGLAPFLPPAVGVNMGNPHAIFFLEGQHQFSLSEIGPKVEHHPLFPERVNVSLARKNDDNSITLNVWERGSGITLACGTAACATFVAAVRTGVLEDTQGLIHLPGGDLLIEWQGGEQDNVWMTGPVQEVFRGSFDLPSGEDEA